MTKKAKIQLNRVLNEVKEIEALRARIHDLEVENELLCQQFGMAYDSGYLDGQVHNNP